MLDGVEAIQKMTDKSTKEIDEIVSKKEKEVMTV
jgi:ribosome recycling factor